MNKTITLHGQDALDWIKDNAPEDYPHIISDIRKRKQKVEGYKLVMMPADSAEEEADALIKLMNEHNSKGNLKVEYLPSIKHSIN